MKKRIVRFLNRLTACIDFLFCSKDEIWTIVYNTPDKEEYVYSTDDSVDEQNEEFKILVKSLYRDVVLFSDEIDDEPNTED